MSDTLERARLDAIAKRSAAAGPGPWRRDGDGVFRTGSESGGEYDEEICAVALGENAEFIANARADIPFLLNHIQALEKTYQGELASLILCHWQRSNKQTDGYNARIAALEDEVARLRKEGEQHHAKATCMCGSYVKEHGIGDGHSPVSMYDHEMDQLRADVEHLTTQVNLWKAEEFAARDRAENAEAEADRLRLMPETAQQTDPIAYEAARRIIGILEREELAAALTLLGGRLNEARCIIRDLVPYAQTAIGLPRPSWPHDSVILRAERALGEQLCS